MATKVKENEEVENEREGASDGPLLDLSDDAVKKMIKAAKKRGYVTMDELNSVLPSEEVTSEQIEDTMAMLSDMGINVIEDEDAEEAAQGEEEGGDDEGESEGGELAASGGTALATAKKKEPTDRTDDPVRMYLREMGSVELLSREGEIAIAKRIEAGRETMIAGLCESPLTFQAIIIWRDELNEGQTLLREIIDLETTYSGPEAKAAPQFQSPEKIEADRKAAEEKEKNRKPRAAANDDDITNVGGEGLPPEEEEEDDDESNTDLVKYLAVARALHPAILAFAVDPQSNRSQAIDRRGMPVRVHVFEDYETDIEKRWWLVGEPTRENVPESTSSSVPNTRCCRATETKNFDRQLEDQAKLWKAVIFNPVPGPPMGPRTRLDFRYRLKGTDTLRVQIYSLSKNYHRFLTLTKLPQEEWHSATVDMTSARRPDGTGGALAEDERIDDIQFYIPPEADLWIDDIVLYEEAAENEMRPFPKRFLFTGWFDTGKQGQEWPGEFEIVPHEKPRTWKAAQSIIDSDTGRPWIRLQLRGPRPLGRHNEVRFRYHLQGSDRLSVVLVDSSTGDRYTADARQLQQGRWAETTVQLPVDKDGRSADELHLVLGRDGVLHVDDVLIYEPGQ